MFDTSGRLLMGATAARDVGGLSSQKLVIEGTDGPSSAISLIDNQNSAGGSPSLSFAKSRGTSVGSNTIVQDGDTLGSIVWCAADGNDIANQSAKITCTVDAAPGSNDTAGRLKFLTSEDGSSSPTSRLEINKDGHVYVKTGSVVLSTSGQGIDFSATGDPTNGASTSELFDYYEEGTFTPAFGGLDSVSYSTQFGRYTRIGRQVFCTATIDATGIDESNNITLTGLPYNSADSGDNTQRSTWLVAYGGHCAGISDATARFRSAGSSWQGVKGTASTTYLTGAELSSSGTINITGSFSYYVD